MPFKNLVPNFIAHAEEAAPVSGIDASIPAGVDVAASATVSSLSRARALSSLSSLSLSLLSSKHPVPRHTLIDLL